MRIKETKKGKKFYFLLIAIIGIILIFLHGLIPIYSIYLSISVEQEFKKIADVEVINMNLDYNESEVHPLVKVKNKGTLLFIDLHKGSFYNPQHLIVKTFGNSTPSSSCYQDNKLVNGGWLDFGSQGNEANLFPFKMHNVRDVVDHYDDIVTTLHTWPNNHRDPHAPRLEKTTKDGKTMKCFYTVEKTNESADTL